LSIAEDDTSTSLLKVPPHSLEAECSVLGGLMLDEMAWDKISSALTADDFYRGDHRVVFRVMEDLVEKNQPLDIITIAEALDSVNELENVGGIAYISELANNTPTASKSQSWLITPPLPPIFLPMRKSSPSARRYES